MSDAFNLFATCYVYGCLALVLLLFIGQAYFDLFLLFQSTQTSKAIGSDFYSQVKELFDSTEEELDRSMSKPQTFDEGFETLTIRELRSYIKDNQLHQLVRDRIGSSVSNARKAELIACLNSI